jgi:uncharacterized membrane protein
MRSRARVLGHSIHPVLIVFPLGLFAAAIIFDIIYLISDRPGFTTAAGYAIGTGIVGGLVAAVFGLVDWVGIPPGTRAKRVGLVHGIGNVAVVLLFTISWFIRLPNSWQPNAAALIFSFLGIALAGVTAWLGGELVERLGVSVDDDAGLDASSSLGMPATVRAHSRRDRMK